jgi:predicted exporter
LKEVMTVRRGALIATLAVIAATVLSSLAIGLGLHLEPNVASLLPDSGDAAALRRYVRGFGGGDLGVVMIKGPDADENERLAQEIADALQKKPMVELATWRIDLNGKSLDPMLLFRHADAKTRDALLAALEPEAMRARLADTRRMLLAPGASALGEVVQKDPLRLAQIVFDKPSVGASGVRTQANGAFANEDGTMNLVFVKPKGQALHGDDAQAFVDDAEAVLAPLRKEHPKVKLGLTGGHAIAAATKDMLISDLETSGTLSMVLASLVFALTFRRFRALLAVMPPLVLGTLWTAGLAAALPGGLSAIAVAFTSVVVGVGVDTGVHVYAALMTARRNGLSGADAAREARRRTTKDVMGAAIIAAIAFGALYLSDIRAVRQLGVLCAAGEVLTAVAIVICTPSIGAWFERGGTPPETPSGWTRVVTWLTKTRGRAIVAAVIALSPIPLLFIWGPPPLAESVIAVRPKALEPLNVQQEIFDAFGGKKGQWVVLVPDKDLEQGRVRGDRLAEMLGAMSNDVEVVDALTQLAPAPETQKARFAARDALDLPKRADDLEKALTEAGFATDRFAGAIEGMRHPSHQIVSLDDVRKGTGAILASRYLGEDEGDHLIALYLRPTDREGAAERIEAALKKADPKAVLTGYSRLESSLRETLRHDMPRIALVAGGLVIFALALSLRSARDVTLAALVIGSEICAVLICIRMLKIPLHAYDALVLPVLLGITVDEGMFLVQHARESKDKDTIEETIRVEGPSIASTALTTAAGFAALGICRFDGLRDLGWVGALGSAIGLVVALVVVPAGLRLWPSKPIEAARKSSG